MDINIAEERTRLQEMRDNPQSDLELAFKSWALDAGSEPHEWSDETVKSATLMFRVFEMGWNAALNIRKS